MAWIGLCAGRCLGELDGLTDRPCRSCLSLQYGEEAVKEGMGGGGGGGPADIFDLFGMGGGMGGRRGSQRERRSEDVVHK